MIKKINVIIEEYIKKLAGNKKHNYVIALVFIGILLIVSSNILSGKKERDIHYIEEKETIGQESEIKEVSLITNVKEIEETYEKDLQVMLNQIKGVSEVEVMINVDSTNVNIYEKDLIYGSQTTDETDKSGGKRNIEDETKETKLVYIRQGDQEVPVLVQTKKPEVRGVFVIAKGVDNANVKQLVVEAVSRVLDVPTYRISVMPK